jgi:glycosyltransferase involved in cell wall biosynthesis
MKNVELVLFFTRGMSLHHWDQIGMFDREVALYERLRNHGVKVSFITYGGTSELNYNDRLSGIQILCNTWGLPNHLYEKFLHRFHSAVLKSCDLIKTNQMDGAQIALRCAKHWKKPLIGRMGYIWSDFVGRESGNTNGAFIQVQKIENNLFNSAERIIVTTPEMAKSLQDRVPELLAKTMVIPNYVETDRFSPGSKRTKDFEVTFVGRLSPQKNVGALLDAVTNLDVNCLIIGSGTLRDELQSQYGDASGKIRWEGNIPNSELPSVMNRSRIFILPSHYEGHPKTLIEAMSCGMPVIGADSPGIREIIDHGINGLLCGIDSESIGRSIKELLDNPDLCETLGNNARQYVLDHFSLDRVLKMEYQLYREILDEHTSRAVN